MAGINTYTYNNKVNTYNYNNGTNATGNQLNRLVDYKDQKCIEFNYIKIEVNTNNENQEQENSIEKDTQKYKALREIIAYKKDILRCATNPIDHSESYQLIGEYLSNMDTILNLFFISREVLRKNETNLKKMSYEKIKSSFYLARQYFDSIKEPIGKYTALMKAAQLQKDNNNIEGHKTSVECAEKWLDLAKKKMSHSDWYKCDIAIAQANQGNFKEATEFAMSNIDLYRKSITLTKICAIQYEADNNEADNTIDIQETLGCAKEYADKIREHFSGQYRVFREIATIEYKQGKRDDAQKTLERAKKAVDGITDPYPYLKSKAWMKIFTIEYMNKSINRVEETSNGCFSIFNKNDELSKARNTLANVERTYPHLFSEPLGDVKVLVKMATIEYDKNNHDDAKHMFALAKETLKNHRESIFSSLYTTANSSKVEDYNEDYIGDELLSKIVTGEVKQVEFERAEQTANSITDSRFRSDAFKTICIAYAEKGKFEKAIQIANSNDVYNSARDELLSEIVTAQAKQCKFEGATTTAKSIKSPVLKCNAQIFTAESLNKKLKELNQLATEIVVEV